MSTRSERPPVGAQPRSRGTGLLVAGLAVAATTAVIYPLRDVAPAVSTGGVVYLLAVLMVSTYWGSGLGLVTGCRLHGGLQLSSTSRRRATSRSPTRRTGWRSACSWPPPASRPPSRSWRARAPPMRSCAGRRRIWRRRWPGRCSAARTCRGRFPRRSKQLADALDLPLGLDPADAGPDPARSRSSWARGRPACIHGADAEPRASRGCASASCRRSAALLPAALERERLHGEVVETAALRRSDVIKTALLRSGLARPAHAVDVDHRGRGGACGRRRCRRRARRARRAASSARRAACRGWWRSCSTSPGCRPAPRSRAATGARSRRS